MKGIVCRKQKISYRRYPKSMPRSILCRYSSTNGDRNTYPCRPKAGITFLHKRCRCRPTKPTSRLCRGSRPPSTASAAPRRESHTYGGDAASEAPVQDEQRKTWTGTLAARQRAMVEEIPDSSCSARLQLGNHEIEREIGN